MAQPFGDSDNGIFRTLVDSIGDHAIFTLDTAGRVLTWNLGAQRIKGYRPEEIIGQHFSRFYTAGDIAAGKPQKGLELAQRNGHHQEEGLRVRKDGSTFWASVMLTPLKDPSGQVIGYGKVTRDISQPGRLRFLGDASAELLGSLDYASTLEKVARLAVPFLADWCVVHLVKNGVLELAAVAHVDPAKVSLARDVEVRYPPDPRESAGVWQVVRSGKPEIYPEITKAMLEASAKDAAHARVLRQVGLRSALIVPLMLAGKTSGALSLIHAESGRRYGPEDVGFALDIARRCALAIDNAEVHREVARDRQRLAQEVEVREMWMAVLGHDLRSPLSAVGAAAHALQKHDLSPRDLQLARRIESSAHRMGVMIAQLLDLARTRLGSGVGLKRRVATLASICREVIAENEAAHPEVEFTFTQDVTGKGQWDPDRLEQVISNLVSNAVHHGTPGGPVKLRLWEEGDHFKVSVNNLGRSIRAEQLPTLFEPFRRGGSSSGLGLGLYIANQIVVAHGGSIEVVSEKSRGTTFTVVLPRPVA